MTHLELYKQQIKKLYPDIEEEEFNKMVEEFEADMVKQWGSIKEQWVKVVAAQSGCLTPKGKTNTSAE